MQCIGVKNFSNLSFLKETEENRKCEKQNAKTKKCKKIQLNVK